MQDLLELFNGQENKDDVKLPYKVRLSRVEVNKKEGNDLFKDKNYSMAVQRYVLICICLNK